jgi:hypothetical protein
MSLGLAYYLADLLSGIAIASGAIAFISGFIFLVSIPFLLGDGDEKGHLAKTMKRALFVFIGSLTISLLLPHKMRDYYIIFGVDKVVEAAKESLDNGTLKDVNELVDLAIEKAKKELQNENRTE